MRTDMKKVLCEQPRSGSSRRYHDVRCGENRGDPEDLPSQRGMRRPYIERGTTKDLTDHIAPLYRFFDGSVGRRYDDVWSELCARVSGGDTMSEHVKGHARDAVERHVVMIEGVPYKKGSGRSLYSRSERYRLGLRRITGLYVDPDDGVIRDAGEYRRAPRLTYYAGASYVRGGDGVLYPSKAHNRGRYPLFVVGGEREAVQIAGVWYWVVYADVPPPMPVTTTKDGVTVRRMQPQGRCDWLTGQTLYAGRYRSSKRQMAARDLRRHGLLNVG